MILANNVDCYRLKKTTVDVPTLFIAAERDNVLRPAMSHGMEKNLPRLTRGSVSASHWAMIQKPDEVNRIVKRWLDTAVFVGKSSL